MRRIGWWQPGLALLAAVCVPMLLAVLSGTATVHCVPVAGGWADAGLRLALLAPDEACPFGTLAVGATAGQALTVVVAVAVPALLAHLALATGAAGALGALRAVVVAAARRLVHAVLPGVSRTLPARPRLAVAPVPPARPTGAAELRRPHRRGPPVLLGVHA
ncbi:hypothetical protein [Georgenia sp. AZ-5]|uniref:hypothetical protein n=1 Tax=Georgenia sp. AZ-5 TaxID=3367526 RepID=UPI003754A299